MATPDADYYRLRTEWLRFKSQLFDGLTSLPALPAILEDIRRLVEIHGSADVVYLDLGRSGRHETKLGWAAYDGAVKEFAAILRSLRSDGVLRSEDIVCLHTVRSDRFLVFMGRPDPELAPAGRRTAAVRRDRIVKELQQRIAGAPESSPLHSIRVAAGHSRIQNDPVIRSERAVHQAVSDAMLMSLVEKEGVEAVRRDELQRIIAQGCIRSVYHPIVKLQDRSVIGHEALTRPVGPVAFESIEELFAFAESSDLVMEFERLCRHTAVRSAREVKGLGMLFLNASARAVEDPEWSGTMDGLLAASGLRPHDVVIEITERTAIVHHDDFQGALRGFKKRGFRVAVDDMGAGYASFQSLASIEPDFLKFDVSLVRDIDRSSIKRSLLESLHQLAEKINARVIAEGVERPEERDALLALGIELGQGWLFHKPS